MRSNLRTGNANAGICRRRRSLRWRTGLFYTIVGGRRDTYYEGRELRPPPGHGVRAHWAPLGDVHAGLCEGRFQ